MDFSKPTKMITSDYFKTKLDRNNIYYVAAPQSSNSLRESRADASHRVSEKYYIYHKQNPKTVWIWKPFQKTNKVPKITLETSTVILNAFITCFFGKVKKKNKKIIKPFYFWITDSKDSTIL